MKGVLERMGPSLREGAIVTDVGSVKGLLSELLPGTLPAGVHYVGSHPMAGSHERGIGSARADLFEGKPCVVDASGDAGAADRVARFWEALGARVVRRDADRHDAEVAWTSHVPHLLAFAFARSLARAPEGAFEVAGSGFRDFTRIAKSEAELWSDILGSNRKAIAGPLQAFRDALAELSQAVEAGDTEALEGLLAAARRSLHRASSAEEGPETNPSPNGDRPQQRRSKHAS
jgi:prephenate dehydrogenase